ncbi:MAG: hypothetical protein WCX30_01950 [Candidatus Paceibacterota bacterium]|jgi:hypothetical protein|nr:hypothetical protein [bacterium]
MLAKIGKFVKASESEIVLSIAVILVSLLSFSFGYIMAKNEAGQQIKIIERDINPQK